MIERRTLRERPETKREKGLENTVNFRNNVLQLMQWIVTVSFTTNAVVTRGPLLHFTNRPYPREHSFVEGLNVAAAQPSCNEGLMRNEMYFKVIANSIFSMNQQYIKSGIPYPSSTWKHLVAHRWAYLVLNGGRYSTFSAISEERDVWKLTMQPGQSSFARVIINLSYLEVSMMDH